MKKSTKLLSLLLAVIMVFSALPIAAGAKAVDSDVKTIESFISNAKLANLVEYLVTNINDKKEDVTGSVLRLVYLFIEDEELQGIIGKRDVTALDDEATAKILIDWLNKKLPEWTKDINNNDIVSLINNVIPGLTVKLDSVDNVFATLASVDNYRLIVNALGDARNLDVSAVKNVTVAKNGNFGVIKQAIQFVEDNLTLIKKFINGTLTFGNGIAGRQINNALADILAAVKDLPGLVKSYIYLLIDGRAAAGEFANGKTRGDWGSSAYKNYTADQLLAAALIRFVTGTDDVVSASDADAAAKLSFYQLLGQYAPDLYNTYAITWLNDNLQDLITKISITPEITARFNQNIAKFTKNTFKDIFKAAKKDGILSQINNLVVKIADLILSDSAKKELKLTSGGNENLNKNLLAIARYTLPAMAEKKAAAILMEEFGYDFSPFTKKAVAKMELSDMAVALLKLFVGTWFEGAAQYKAAQVSSAKTLPQLSALLMYYTATNTEWLDIDYDFTAIKKKILSGNTVKDISANAAKDIIISLAAGIGIGALQKNKDKLHFHETIDASDWQSAAVAVSNWALGFLGGIPAVVTKADLTNANDYGPFYKLNVLLNEFIDFSFLNNVSTDNFKLDLETLIRSALLDNLFRFDLEGLIGVFTKNTKKGNILNAQLIPSLIGVADRFISALFEHECSYVTVNGATFCEISGHFPAGVLGDLDGDNSITPSDARLALRLAVGLNDNLTEIQKKNADVDHKDGVTPGDARLILRRAVGFNDPEFAA